MGLSSNPASNFELFPFHHVNIYSSQNLQNAKVQRDTQSSNIMAQNVILFPFPCLLVYSGHYLKSCCKTATWTTVGHHNHNIYIYIYSLWWVGGLVSLPRHYPVPTGDIHDSPGHYPVPTGDIHDPPGRLLRNYSPIPKDQP